MGRLTDPYKVLQVDREASDEVLEAAYRRLAKMYHPDVSPGAGSAAKMAEINAAHDLLHDPASRRRVDEDLARSARSSPPGPESAQAKPSASSAPRRPGQQSNSQPGPRPTPQTGPRSASRPDPWTARRTAARPTPAPRPWVTADPLGAPWFYDKKKYSRVQVAIAIVGFLLFVVTPLFDPFTEPITVRLGNGLMFWFAILVIEVVIDLYNWQTTPLFRLLFLFARTARRLVIALSRMTIAGLRRLKPNPQKGTA